MQRIEFEGMTGVLLGRWQVAVEIREQGPLKVGLGEVGVFDEDAMEQEHGFVAIVFVHQLGCATQEKVLMSGAGS